MKNLERYVVSVPHGLITERIVVRARSYEESFQEALRALAKVGVKYVDIDKMKSEKK